MTNLINLGAYLATWMGRIVLLFTLVSCAGGPKTGELNPTHRLPDTGSAIPESVRRILASPDSLKIYALHPYEEASAEHGVPSLAGHLILGEAIVEGPDDQAHILNLLCDGIAGWDGTFAFCFIPRHAVRVTQGTTTLDIAICYECSAVSIPAIDDGAGIDAKAEPEMTAAFEQHGLEVFSASIDEYDRGLVDVEFRHDRTEHYLGRLLGRSSETPEQTIRELISAFQSLPSEQERLLSMEAGVRGEAIQIQLRVWKSRGDSAVHSVTFRTTPEMAELIRNEVAELEQ